MAEGSSGSLIFHQLEIQNPEIAEIFHSFRQHELEPARTVGRQGPFADRGYQHWASYRRLRRSAPRSFAGQRSLLAPLLVLVGLAALAITAGPAVARFLAAHWREILIPTGSVCLGAGTVLLVARVGVSPLRGVAPPQPDADDPLKELKNLADRAALRLRAAYRLQLWAVVAVGCILAAAVVWSMVMVSQQRVLYASAFGSGSVGMLVLARWKWQPFERINEARRLADNADILATGLRLRMATISEISNPTVRARAQWDAVKAYLDRS